VRHEDTAWRPYALKVENPPIRQLPRAQQTPCGKLDLVRVWPESTKPSPSSASALRGRLEMAETRARSTRLTEPEIVAALTSGRSTHALYLDARIGIFKLRPRETLTFPHLALVHLS